MHNYYWPIYLNLENELITLTNAIHIDDNQLKVYSVKIAELLIRTSVEVESLSKHLYFINGGTKPDDNDLYFDTDCLQHLNSLWDLSSKEIKIVGMNFFLENEENKTIRPLHKAYKRGSSSSKWLIAYQAVKHNRIKSIKVGNLGNLITALGALFILNIYLKFEDSKLLVMSDLMKFDTRTGSAIFSLNLEINKTMSLEEYYKPSQDYKKSILIAEPEVKSYNFYRDLMKRIFDEIKENFKKEKQEIIEKFGSNQDLINEEFNKYFESHGDLVGKKFTPERDKTVDMKYKVVLNKNQHYDLEKIHSEQ